MKILVLCQYYAPEPFRIADICTSLVKEGNEVDVVTSFPNYPEGNIYEGYKNGAHRDEVIDSVNVHRVFTIPRKTGVIRRMINYYTYSIFSCSYINKLKKDYDVVFCYQLSPVLMAKAAVKYKRKKGKKLLLYCLDLWPDSLTLGGIKKGSLVYNHYKNVSEKIYKQADKILVSSRGFEHYFEEMLKTSAKKIDYLPQYAEDMFTPSNATNSDTVNLTFAGNIGTTQSVETILYAANILKNENVIFNIYGDGSGFLKANELKEKLQLKNVVFHGRKSVEEMPEIYAESDGLIVTLKNNYVLSSSFPGKIQSYMAAGKPVIGAINGEASRIIREAECGFCVPAEDYEALAESIRAFLVSDKETLGKNARKYYEENFKKEDFIKRLTEELRKLR